MKIHFSTFISLALEALILWNVTNCEPRFGHMRIVAGSANPGRPLTDHQKFNFARQNVFTAAIPSKYSDSVHAKQTRLSQRIPLRNAGVKLPPNLPNSPIFYVKLPPTTANYVRKPSSPSWRTRPLHVPLKFRSNGKPSNIYVANRHEITTRPTPTTVKPKESKIFRVKGPFRFNGKPGNVALQSSNYFKSLHQFYPKLKNVRY